MSMYSCLAQTEEFYQLCEVSSKLGTNPLQVQGAGGNTSLKRDGAMWIKASGAWLAEANRRDIMVPVAVNEMKQAILRGDPRAADASAFIHTADNASGFKASIETSMHAVLDWPVVLHTHCVATIAATLGNDVREYLADRLSWVKWQYVPYVKPGIDLATLVLEYVYKDTEVIVLGNHGVVVCGTTVSQTEELLQSVSKSLEPDNISASTYVNYRFGRRLHATGWCLVDHPPTASIAMDPASLDVVTQSLYPDHLVFLGPGAIVAPAGYTPEQALSRAQGTKKLCKLLFFRGEGAAIPADATPSMRAMARAIGDVLARINPEKVSNILTHDDELRLLHWDAEQYRSTFNTHSESIHH